MVSVFADCCLEIATIPDAESPEHDAQWTALLPRERDDVSPRAIAKRRVEFAAGRACGRTAVTAWHHRHSDVPAVVFALVRRQTLHRGRPVLVDAQSLRPLPKPVHVSISHAAGLVAAAACRYPIGVDVAQWGSVTQGAQDEALVHSETECWRQFCARCVAQATFAQCTIVQDETERSGADSSVSVLAATLAFAAKEAVLKWLRIGMAIPLHTLMVLPRLQTLRTGASIDGRGGMVVLLDAHIARSARPAHSHSLECFIVGLEHHAVVLVGQVRPYG